MSFASFRLKQSNKYFYEEQHKFKKFPQFMMESVNLIILCKKFHSNFITIKFVHEHIKKIYRE